MCLCDGVVEESERGEVSQGPLPKRPLARRPQYPPTYHQATVVDHVLARVAEADHDVECLARAHGLGKLHLHQWGAHGGLVDLRHGGAQEAREEEGDGAHDTQAP